MKRKILFIIAATMLLFGCKKYIDYSAIKVETFYVNGLSFEMVYVEGGSFDMELPMSSVAMRTKTSVLCTV